MHARGAEDASDGGKSCLGNDDVVRPHPTPLHRGGIVGHHPCRTLAVIPESTTIPHYSYDYLVGTRHYTHIHTLRSHQVPSNARNHVCYLLE
jgi:hypothetical protein